MILKLNSLIRMVFNEFLFSILISVLLNITLRQLPFEPEQISFIHFQRHRMLLPMYCFTEKCHSARGQKYKHDMKPYLHFVLVAFYSYIMQYRMYFVLG